ncbi:MAG: TRAP transporter small permease [Desulfatiglandales bacterium]
MSKILNALDKVLTQVEEIVLFIATMAALFGLFLNVVMRYGFKSGIPWSEELVREVIIVTTFLGCSTAIKLGTMIKIDALYQIKPKLKTPLTIFGNLVALLYSILLLSYGWKLTVLQAKTGQTTIIMQLPLQYLYAVMPVAGAFMAVRCIQVLYRDFKALSNK